MISTAASARPFLLGSPMHNIALDRSTVRRIDQDGHLFVEMTPISKANVCPYWGREIPGYEILGLDADTTYRLYRDAGELAKAVSTFAGKPVLLTHIPVSADDHPRDVTVGAIGDDVQFIAPYLMAPLTIWDGEAIALIESGEQKELSSAYRYDPVMSPGVSPEGESYDGIMTNISGNHLALVTLGRAGSDVLVQDSAFQPKPKETLDMGVLTRKAALVQGALTAYLAPLLAADAKIDTTPLLAGIDAKNYASKRQSLIAGVKTLTTGKLAKDAKLDGLTAVLMALDAVDPKEEDDKKAEDEETKDPRKWLEGKLSEDDMKAWDDICKQEAMDEDEDEDVDKQASPKSVQSKEDKEAAKSKSEEKADKGNKASAETDKPEKEQVDKKAMDRAISTAVKGAQDEMRRTQREIREAEEDVRPYVGKLAMAHDSAADVYRTALGALGVKDVEKLHTDALRPILKNLPIPGTERRPMVTMDASAAKSYAERFPNAARIGRA
jgi:hypothetical protein